MEVFLSQGLQHTSRERVESLQAEYFSVKLEFTLQIFICQILTVMILLIKILLLLNIISFHLSPL